jgi:hypothetical protein
MDFSEFLIDFAAACGNYGFVIVVKLEGASLLFWTYILSGQLQHGAYLYTHLAVLYKSVWDACVNGPILISSKTL